MHDSNDGSTAESRYHERVGQIRRIPCSEASAESSATLSPVCGVPSRNTSGVPSGFPYSKNCIGFSVASLRVQRLTVGELNKGLRRIRPDRVERHLRPVAARAVSAS